MKNKNQLFIHQLLFFRVTIGIFAMLAILTLSGHRVEALAGIVVNSTADVVANDGACTLREAIINANNNDQSGSTDCASGAPSSAIWDEITFDASLTGQRIVLNGTPLTIDSRRLRINGLGRSLLSIDANGQSRVLEILVVDDVVINDLTIENGLASDNNGTPQGGGIYIVLAGTNSRQVTLNRVRITNNLAVGTNAEVQGGGIYAIGFVLSTLVVNDSVIDNNEARATATSDNGASASGGGIYIEEAKPLFTDVTIEDNEAMAVDNGNIAPVSGGGITIQNRSVGGAVFSGVEISNNDASQGENNSSRGGGFYAYSVNGIIISDSRIRHNRVGDAGTSSATTPLGGGLAIIDSSLTLQDSLIAHNVAGDGGGIYQARTTTACSSLNIEKVTLVHNVAQNSGGGMMTSHTGYRCNITVSKTMVQGNTAKVNGGGLHLFRPAVVTIEKGTFVTNTTQTGDGAGLYSNMNGYGINSPAQALHVEDTTFFDNDSAARGGGVYFWGDDSDQMHLYRSTFQLNRASGGGGGVYHRSASDSTVQNSTFSQNLSTSIINESGDLTLTNITAVNGSGYHVHRVGGTVNLRNSLLAMSGGFSCSGTIDTGGYPNMAADSSCGATIVSGSGLPLSMNMNGGYTKTFLPYSYSNAVDAGHNGLCAALGNVDQRGLTRPVDGNGSSGDGNACDLGAVERQPCVAVTEPVVNTAVVGDDVTLSWAPVSGASLYNVYGSTADAYFLVLLPIAQGGATTYEADDVLSSAYAAYYMVRSENECGNLSPFTNQRVGVFQFELDAGS